MGPSLETLLMELYAHRQPTECIDGNHESPFQNVPSKLMHELDGAYLILKSQLEVDIDDDTFI